MRNLKQFFKGFKKGMDDFGHLITILINSIILSIVYLIGVGITSMFSKLFQKHFFEKEFSKKNTYWEDLNLKTKKFEEYYRRF